MEASNADAIPAWNDKDFKPPEEHAASEPMNTASEQVLGQAMTLVVVCQTTFQQTDNDGYHH